MNGKRQVNARVSPSLFVGFTEVGPLQLDTVAAAQEEEEVEEDEEEKLFLQTGDGTIVALHLIDTDIL